MFPSKVEIRLHKVQVVNWPSLEKTAGDQREKSVISSGSAPNSQFRVYLRIDSGL